MSEYLTLIFKADDERSMDKLLERYKKRLGKKADGVSLGVIAAADVTAERDGLEELVDEIIFNFGGFSTYIDDADEDMDLEEFVDWFKAGKPERDCGDE